MDSILNQSSAVCSKCGKAALYTVNGRCEECLPSYSVEYEVIGSQMYFIWNDMLYRADFGAVADEDGVPVCMRYVCQGHMAEQAKRNAKRLLAEHEEQVALIKSWSKYCSVGYYSAQADVDTLIIYFGNALAKEYMDRKVDGDSITLKEFAKEKGIKGILPCL